jgi:gliding motility-associated-like protein
MNLGYLLLRTIFLTLATILLSVKAIAQKPKADFEAISSISGCSPLIVQFEDRSTSNPTQWIWDFGNGNIINQPFPAPQVYTLPGTYTVKLTVRNASGEDSLVRQNYITVFPNPVVDFTVSDSVNCFPLNATFTPLITVAGGGTITKYEWGFGDGDSSQQASPIHAYKFDNNFNVTLRATTDKGCVSFLTKTSYIRVSQGVRPSFYNSFASSCKPPSVIEFFNNSAGPGSLTYSWNFGDGASDNSPNPSHVYNAPGNYRVRMLLTSSSGCSDSAVNFIDIPNTSISSSISALDTGCAGVPIIFTNISTPSADSSGWKFSDGSETTGKSVQKIFARPGTYTVKLTNLFTSCLDSAVKLIVITDTAAVDFTSPDLGSCRAPYTSKFTALAPQATEFFWDFGDGGTSTEQNPSHTYTKEGSYSVTLIIKNRNGCSSKRIKHQFVRISPPAIRSSNLPDSGCAPLTVTANADIFAPDGVKDYFWNFGFTTSTDKNPVITYNSTGSYDVTLSITTNNGCMLTYSWPSGVRLGTRPNADFSASPLLSCAGDSVKFTDLSSGIITGYTWDFSDPVSGVNNNSVMQNPAHLFSGIGIWTVTLKVFNNGCVREMKKNDYIQTYGAVARFKYKVNCTSNRRQVQFTDSSSDAITRVWDFGDGNTSTALNPTHTYAAFGNYFVTLTVSDGGCVYKSRKFIKVLDEKATFTVSPSLLCRGAITTFRSNARDSNLIKYEWDPGTGMLLPGDSSYKVVFDTPRVYNVAHVITDVNGCTDTTRRNIGVGGPRALFNAVNPTGCKGLTVNFKDSSLTDGVNSIVSRTWDFGDGSVESFPAPPIIHQYPGTGFFNVKLVVRDSQGCIDSMVRNSYVVTTAPKADFSSPDSLSCPGKNVQFLTRSNGVNLTHTWFFGDGKSVSGPPNPRNTYASSNQYDVKLIIRDRYGCPDSITIPRYININVPVASFSVSDTVANCPPLIAKFQFKGRYFTSYRWDFGDNDAAVNKDTATKFYGIPGTYRAQLIVTSPGGCNDTAFKMLKIFGPNGRFDYNPKGGCPPTQVDFTLFTQNTDSIKWFFGDNNVNLGRDTVVSNIYRDSGTFVPLVILKDVSGCELPLRGRVPVKVVRVFSNFSADNSIVCDKGPVKFRDSTLTNGSIQSWDWDFGDGSKGTGPAPVHFYNAPGLYNVKLRVTTEFGCVDSIMKSAFVKVVPSPNTAILSADTVCQYRNITFSGKVVTPDTSALSWQWNFANGNTASVQDPPTQPYPVPGTFTVQMLVRNSSGCIDTVLKSVTVHPKPNIDAGKDTTICLGQPINLAATGGSAYTWLPPTATLSCTTCASPVGSPSATTVYNLRGVNTFGCSADDSIRVTVIQPTKVVAPPSDSLCIGQGLQLTATGTQVYSWSPTTALNNPNSSSPIARPTVSTMFVVTGSDTKGCFVTQDSVFIHVFPYPTVELGRDTTIIVGSSLRLNPKLSTDIASITWDPLTGLSCSDCIDPLAMPKKTTTYNLKVMNNGGCLTTDQITVYVICNNENYFVPNTFSPNNDGMNDVFYPRGRGLAQIRSVRIFNRWGQQIFSRTNVLANDPSTGWDGTFKGQPVTPDVYVYMIDVVCENNAVITLKGDLMLIR